MLVDIERYPVPFDEIFGRNLLFVALLEKTSSNWMHPFELLRFNQSTLHLCFLKGRMPDDLP